MQLDSKGGILAYVHSFCFPTAYFSSALLRRSIRIQGSFKGSQGDPVSKKFQSGHPTAPDTIPPLLSEL